MIGVDAGQPRGMRAGAAALRATLCAIAGALILGGCAGGDEATTADGRHTPQVRDGVCCPEGSGLLGSVVNGPDHEYAPVVESITGAERLWFTSSRAVPGKKATPLPADLFSTTRPGTAASTPRCAAHGWARAQSFPPVQGDFDRWTKGSSALRGDTMIIAVEQPLDRERRLVTAASSYKLYLWTMVRLADGPFGNPEPMDSVNLASAWTSQPALSPSGDTLLFASDRPHPSIPGDTSINLWMSFRRDGRWTSPVPVPGLGTPGNDMSPAIDARGGVYYSSNWDVRANRPGTRGYDIWYAGPLDSVAAGRAVPVDMNALTSVPGCQGSRPYEVNTTADEIFPSVHSSEFGATLYWSSNRPGGFGGYDIYGCALPSPCVRLIPVVECFEGGAVPEEDIDASGRRMDRQPLIVTINGTSRSAVSGEVITVRVGDHVTVERAGTNDECVSVVCRPVSLRVPFSDRVITVPVRCDCNRTPVESVVISDASGIPYFITGYWWPNTRSNFDAFQRTYASGALRASRFIDRGDYDYACAADRIDEFFQREVYDRMDRALAAMDPCAGELALQVTVIGYTDACGLAQGQYSADGDVVVGGVRIDAGTSMWARSLPAASGSGMVRLPDDGQRGNIILSKLRAHFTQQTIDRHMTEHSERYRSLKARNRIMYDTDGFGIYDRLRWRNAPPPATAQTQSRCRKTVRDKTLWCNDPEGRRIEIYMTIVPVGDTTQMRPPATDLLTAEAVDPAAAVRECDCYRIEHSFANAADAEFVFGVLQRLTGDAMQRDSLRLERRVTSRGDTGWVLRSGCLSTQSAASSAATALRGAAGRAGDLLRSYAPATSMQCALFGISMGTLRYQRNADALRDTLAVLIDGAFHIERTRASDGATVYRVREGMYRTEKDAQERIEAIRGRLQRAGLVLPMKVIRELK